MIINCNSCGKKFVVPDKAITMAGRTVQCGSCGNKWKQFPIKSKIAEPVSIKKEQPFKSSITNKISKPRKNRPKKTREINLYSPEYLQKKHGINLNKIESNEIKSKNVKSSFGFYNSLILLIVSVIAFSRGLYFAQDFISNSFPFTRFYLDYFFEFIRNMFEIWKHLISSY